MIGEESTIKLWRNIIKAWRWKRGASAKSCMVMELPEIISIDYLLRRVNRNDQEAMQLLKEVHSQLEQILKEGVGAELKEGDLREKVRHFE